MRRKKQEDPAGETGITPLVRTYTSGYTLQDIVDTITDTKTEAVQAWLNEKKVPMKKILIIGTYLTGARLASRLAKKSRVTVLDIYPHLENLLDPGITFASGLSELPGSRWDVIVDTSGLGGISPDILRTLPCPGAFIVEDPCSDGSDNCIRKASRCGPLAQAVPAGERGILTTRGMQSKTSGSMTILMDILRYSLRDALREKGVLYGAATMESFERILFQEKDAEKFRERLNQPALRVSSLSDVNCDRFIERNLSEVTSWVKSFPGGDVHDSIPSVQKDRGMHPLGSVIGGRSGWFYRPR